MNAKICISLTKVYNIITKDVIRILQEKDAALDPEDGNTHARELAALGEAIQHLRTVEREFSD